MTYDTLMKLTTTLTAAALAGCCELATDPKPLVETPERHRPLTIMGRDCWRVLNRYTAYGWTGQLVGFDNPEFNESEAIRDTVPTFVAAANPPPDSSDLAVWPRLEDYFRPGAPDREILTSNPLPDRPFFLIRRSERNNVTWGSPVEVDLEAYRAWRAKHPNLVMDGNISEWSSDLGWAWAGETAYGKQKKGSARREAAKKAFLGEKPKTRYEHLDLLRRTYRMRQERNFGGSMAVLESHINSLHIAGDCGASLIRMETTASGQYRYQPSAMFTRGAARQFGIPWEWYIAGYVNGPSKFGKGLLGDAMNRYPATPEATGKPHYAQPRDMSWAPGGKMRVGNSGPDFGISRSLFRRTHYLAYLSGANYINLEESRSGVLNIWDKAKGKTVFSPRGEIYVEFAKFMKAHPDRGAHYTPVALCVPLAQGYPTWGGSPFNESRFGYTDGDRAVDAVIYALVPGCDYRACLDRGEEKYLRNSPFADMYDVIAPDAPSQTPEQLLDVMKSYKALVIAGDYPNREWEKTLAKYEAQGGKVVRADKALLAETVKVGKGRGAGSGEIRYPKLEAALQELQKDYFPFEVTGSCAYGLTVAKDHAWLYVFNNDGVIKFADAPQEFDESKASDVTVKLGTDDKSTIRHSSPVNPNSHVKELLSGKAVAVQGGAFRWHLGPGDLAIFEIR